MDDVAFFSSVLCGFCHIVVMISDIVSKSTMLVIGCDMALI